MTLSGSLTTESQARKSSELPRAAYVHVPFCRHRCGYCNFTLVTGRDELIERYLRAIELEVGGAHPTAHEVDTLYFGGGTPTYLSTDQFRELAGVVLNAHPLAAGYEWTVEANPADIDQAMMDTLSELGVTRLSLGAQSFQADKLKLLERDHNPDDIHRAVALAWQENMSVGLDLIFAKPGETLGEWASDLETAVALEPDHVSTYGLTFERGTAFWSRRLHGELSQASEELEREMYALAIDRLSAAGFEHYEVSNFAGPGRRSRHNQVYWSGDCYYAYGPGAARYINGVRETNHRSTTTYLHRVLAGESPVADREELSAEAKARELLVFGLRRIEGVSRRQFFERTGFECDDLVARALQKFVDLALLDDDGERIKLTRDGLFVSDAIWPEML
jgi:oxygen-independent coproporphyrinogen-3 oxidase